MTLSRVSGELLLCFKCKKQTPNPSSSLSFCRDRHRRQSLSGAHSQSPTRSRSGSPSSLGSCRLFPGHFSRSDTHCFPSLPSTPQRKTEAWKHKLPGTPASLKEGLCSTPGSISQLSPSPDTALQNITSNHPHPWGARDWILQLFWG